MDEWRNRGTSALGFDEGCEDSQWRRGQGFLEEFLEK